MKLTIILISFLIFGSSMNLLSVFAECVEQSKQSQQTNSITPGITIFSLENNDYIISSTITTLEKDLEPFYSVTIINIVTVQELEARISNSEYSYIMLVGHSDSLGININNIRISWETISIITDSFPEKTFFIPTCFSNNLHQVRLKTSDNVLSPFEKEIDYHISIDFSLLAIGYLLEDQILLEKGINKMSNDFPYLYQPKKTLTTTKTEYFSEPGTGDFGYINLFVAEAVENAFIIGASAGAAFGAIAMKYLLHSSPKPSLGFLSSLMSFIANWVTFTAFVSTLGQHTFCSGEDLGTTGWSTITYDDLYAGCRIVEYFRYHSVSTYKLKTGIYQRSDGAMVQKVHKVTMTIDVLRTMRFEVGNEFGLFSLWDMKLILWELEDTQTIIHSEPDPPPYIPPPYSGGPGGDKEHSMD
jgi:hypothetical protein